MTTIVDLWPRNIYVQAALGVGSVNFRTVDFGGAFSIGPTVCYVCCLSMMFIFCVKEADLGMMAFVAYFAPWFS